MLKWGDNKFIKVLNRSTYIVAISKYCSDSYKSVGSRADTVIYPPLDLSVFKSSTEKPSRDYVLSYLGKETRADMLKKLADLGIKLKVLGGNVKRSASDILNHDHIEMIGHVSDEELISLYSNALFTAFAFTEEAFGYVPMESMACGTPVLSYNRQGPSESITDDVTGWLCNDDDEFLKTAENIWKDGYSENVSLECVRKASLFDMEVIGDQWDKLICTVREPQLVH